MPGDDNDLRAGVVLDWNLFRGGIDRANRQEHIRRIDEATMALYGIAREVEEDVTRFELDRARFLDMLRRVEDDINEEQRALGS